MCLHTKKLLNYYLKIELLISKYLPFCAVSIGIFFLIPKRCLRRSSFLESALFKQPTKHFFSIDS